MYFAPFGYQPPHQPKTTWAFHVFAHSALILLVLLALPSAATQLATQKGIYVLGAVGVWRYGWAAINLIRAAYYKYYKFPTIRRASNKHAQYTPLYVIVLSYKVPQQIFTACYKNLITEAVRCGRQVTILASVTNTLEQQWLAEMFSSITPYHQTKLLLMQQAGTGKRAAMAAALRAISRTVPPENAEIILMDGDTLIRPETFTKIAGFFEQNAKLGAFTVDNQVLCKGTAVVRAWYDLRFMQRHILMCSQSVSNRVLVLTGRFSVFRATLALQPDFINAIEHDALEHWHYGRIPFVTGDDKSTWFWLLQRGYEMLYVPDVVVDCCEEQRDKNFITHSLPLMQRWFGNMLRNNGRALALTPKRMPFFLWWSLLDQRLSMWTALFSPTVATFLIALVSVHYVWLYVLWLLFTRFAYSLLISGSRKRFSALFPFLLLYNQFLGAWVKITIQFNLPKQGWRQLRRRQQPRLQSVTPYNRAFGIFSQTTALLIFGYGVAVTMNLSSLIP